MANWKVLTLISITIGLVGLTLIITLFTATGGYVPFDYGIVLDAGSSHTQITLYHWSADKNRCTGVAEEVDTCKIDAGISSYDLTNSSAVGLDLLECVNNVSKKIDKDRVHKTPLYLGATAGMRLLNKTEPKNVSIILALISNVFRLNTGFQIKTIDIISGQSEGLFSWVTNNYLMDKLIVDKFNETKPYSTIGMLDMGGASAQIAYRTGSRSDIRNGSTDPSEVSVRLYGINHTVRASSNLCFGADQAMLRFQKYLILTRDSVRDPYIDNPCLSIGSTVNVSTNQFKDQICVKTKNRDVDYNKNFIFNGISDAEKCAELVSKHLLNRTECEKDFDICFNVSDSQPPDRTEFYALSSYYYTVKVLNLTDRMTIDEYSKKMYDFCSSSRAEITENPWVYPKYIDVYCFQLNYIYTTIKTIYRFEDKMWPNIRIANTIRNTQLGWSLGFMINATNAISAEKPTPPVVELFPFILVTTFCTLILLFSIYFALNWIKQNENDRKEQYEPISITT